MFKINNKDTGVFIVKTYFTPCSSVSIVNFEHVNGRKGIAVLFKFSVIMIY